MAILTLAQCECLMIGFALNLIMTASIAWWLIGAFSRAGESPAWWSCLQVGGMLVLLPLCGGSGVILMPPLVLWLAGYVACGWWSGRDIEPWARGISVALLMTSAAITAWYLTGFQRPAYLPPAPSIAAVLKVTLEVLSLAIGPIHWDATRQDAGFYLGYWKLTGMGVLLLSVATFGRLAIVARRSAADRPRALGLIAILVALLGAAASVGVARSGLGADMGMSSRYVTISVPLFGVFYFAWLVYGGRRARRDPHRAVRDGLRGVRRRAAVRPRLRPGPTRPLCPDRARHQERHADVAARGGGLPHTVPGPGRGLRLIPEAQGGARRQVPVPG